MRVVAGVALGIAVGIVVGSRASRDAVEPAAADEERRAVAVAPELASVERASAPPERARLRAASPRVSEGRAGRAGEGVTAEVDVLFVGVPAANAPFGLHPEPVSGNEHASRGPYGTKVDEDVADLVEPRGPYRSDTFLRWI